MAVQVTPDLVVLSTQCAYPGDLCGVARPSINNAAPDLSLPLPPILPIFVLCITVLLILFRSTITP